MKTKRFMYRLLLFTAAILWVDNVGAQRFSLPNEDGVTITYEIVGNQVEVVSDYQNTYRGTVSIPSDVTYDGKKYEVYSIGKLAFIYRDELTSINLPNTIKRIGTGAFSECSALATVKMSEAIEFIGERAFAECSLLESITFPNTLLTIGKQAFYGCNRLTQIELPASLTFIGDISLACRNITSVVSHIEEPFSTYAFGGGNTQPLTTATLCVPAGTKEKYLNTSGWEFANIQEIIPLKGDVNDDGTVNVADISSIITVMANEENSVDADVNGDGVVDVADIALVITIMATSN